MEDLAKRIAKLKEILTTDENQKKRIALLDISFEKLQRLQEALNKGTVPKDKVAIAQERIKTLREDIKKEIEQLDAAQLDEDLKK